MTLQLLTSDDGENEDEDSVEEDCLELSLITNDELTKNHSGRCGTRDATHAKSSKQEKEQEQEGYGKTKMDCLIQLFMLIEFTGDDIYLWSSLTLLGRFWYG
jgi:hypothetical protein